MRRRDPLTDDMFLIPTPVAPVPASMDYRAEVAHLVSAVIKDSGVDRYELAARMSRLTGQEVSKYMVDAWSSESREAYNMPFHQAAVLESACETLALTTWLAEKRGARLLVGKDTLTNELGKLERVKEDAAKKIRELKRIMGEME
ncbi:hypothetical protein E4656_13605 [Natronospirillum operosum]|uniref:Uncharacterized protein n=1 Tax=Natronospirillum operosum TaxID=2759953 RepID=A0A4Z0W7D6_9GAMM|nr:hypothetical protein [Natronospirillum operosum]TGG92502.1 hypothetical protein E4656_13605 [Natronospirillum operosum]